jgi:hypothetical protein
MARRAARHPFIVSSDRYLNEVSNPASGPPLGYHHSRNLNTTSFSETLHPMRLRQWLEIAGLAVAVLMIIGCTALLLGRSPDRNTLGRVLRPTPQVPAQRLDAYLVFQLEDCAGNLEVAHLFMRPSIRERVQLRELLLLGTEAELQAVRRRFAALDLQYPVRRIDRRLATALATLGHQATPFLVVLDERGTVRLSVSSPRTPEEFVRLAALLPRVALR